MEYLNHGGIIHAVNGKQTIEALEVLPQFKGKFTNGITIGEKVSILINKFGLPRSIDSSIARYPAKGIHFTLKKNVLIDAYVFSKK